MPKPKLIGVLSAHQGKAKKTFSFEYKQDWLNFKAPLLNKPKTHTLNFKPSVCTD